MKKAPTTSDGVGPVQPMRSAPHRRATSSDERLDAPVRVSLAPTRDPTLVAGLHALSRRNVYTGLLPAPALAAITEAALLFYWQQRLLAEPHPYLLIAATEGQTIIGFALTTSHPSPTVNHLHVHPDWQRRGVGTRLLEESCRHAASWGHEDIQLWVLAGNRSARCFYRHHGWRENGRRRAEAYGETVVQVRFTRCLIPR